MDVLSDVVDTLELQGTLYFRTVWSPPFGVQVPDHAGAARFHLVVRGRCCVGMADGSWISLEPGDMVLIPRGAAHVLADQPDSEVTSLAQVAEHNHYDGVLSIGEPVEGCAATEMICGHFSFASGADHPLLRALPDQLLVSTQLRSKFVLLDGLMQLIPRAMFAEQAGVEAAVIRLSEALFVEAVRACASRDQELHCILTAMTDPRIGKALQLMHRDPARSWTVESLGQEVAMSRSRFAAEFQQRLGKSPMAYLTDWRLQKARRLLKRRANVQQVAYDVGYRSAAAFTRAFTQHFGHSPTTVRRIDELAEAT